MEHTLWCKYCGKHQKSYSSFKVQIKCYLKNVIQPCIIITHCCVIEHLPNQWIFLLNSARQSLSGSAAFWLGSSAPGGRLDVGSTYGVTGPHISYFPSGEPGFVLLAGSGFQEKELNLQGLQSPGLELAYRFFPPPNPINKSKAQA